ncbi:transmembrane protein 71 isoform X1 [Pseudoliparis swirei]|uniref:transmembrane protein 71 isoform X1 n=1 Tax=Pseudoliparis swirei TaxID=2059687 RepID=UPI0024BEDDAF|nr:transmembrane protein 71 isoform X1 [Pseudoliparis swirei]
MDLFFSGAVTSSPVKRRLRANQSLDVSLLSPDSSYFCSVVGGAPCSCRRSPRLLTNGYYGVTEDSFSWDGRGNVALAASVSYKENPVRVFRRRRRPRRSLVRLLSDVTESCQSWLDEKVFGGVFRTDQDQDYARTSQEGPVPLAEATWSGSMLSSTELDGSRSFTYDHTEIPPPPDKVAPPLKTLLQEEVGSEACQSLGGLSEVPPPSAPCSCCQASPEQPGLMLLFIVLLFILTALYSGSLVLGATVSCSVAAALRLVTTSGPMAEWRRAKTEDITSGNE